MFTLRATPNKSQAAPAPSLPANTRPPDIASASVPDALAALHVNPDTGLTHAEVDVCRKDHGYNEVAEKKGHPVLKFLGKFWGVSAWMLELIMVLSAILRKYSDLAVVSALLVVNAVLSFMQEHRAAGVVETLRRRLQVSARVLRDSIWQLIAARDLVPGDIIPADVILLLWLRLAWRSDQRNWQNVGCWSHASAPQKMPRRWTCCAWTRPAPSR
jgi:H+-transporting ATPase